MPINIANQLNTSSPGFLGGYMQGKAMRLAEMHENRRMEIQEEDRLRDIAKEDRAIADRQRSMGRQEKLDAATEEENAFQRNRQEEADAQRNVEDEREGAKAFLEDPEIISRLEAIERGEDDGTAFNAMGKSRYPKVWAQREDTFGDGVTREEATAAKNEILKMRGVQPKGYKAKEGYVGADGKKYLLIINDDGSTRKTGILIDDNAKSTEYHPPNKNDMDMAGTIIGANEIASDMSNEDEKKAIYWVATKLRELQYSGMKPGQAMVRAEEELESMLSLEKSFFSADTVLNLENEGPGLNEGVFVIQGQPMRRDADGNIVRVR